MSHGAAVAAKGGAGTSSLSRIPKRRSPAPTACGTTLLSSSCYRQVRCVCQPDVSAPSPRFALSERCQFSQFTRPTPPLCLFGLPRSTSTAAASVPRAPATCGSCVLVQAGTAFNCAYSVYSYTTAYWLLCSATCYFRCRRVHKHIEVHAARPASLIRAPLAGCASVSSPALMCGRDDCALQVLQVPAGIPCRYTTVTCRDNVVNVLRDVYASPHACPQS